MRRRARPASRRATSVEATLRWLQRLSDNGFNEAAVVFPLGFYSFKQRTEIHGEFSWRRQKHVSLRVDREIPSMEPAKPLMQRLIFVVAKVDDTTRLRDSIHLLDRALGVDAVIQAIAGMRHVEGVRREDRIQLLGPA